MDIKEIKRIEREKFKKLRNKSSLVEKNNVRKNVEIFIKSFSKENLLKKYIAIYWPLRGEIDLRMLKQNYRLALPKCNPMKKIDFYSWDTITTENDFEGIPSPKNGNLLDSKDLSLILVPCLSIDKDLIRLGYGGGYYDKLRSDPLWRSIKCLGILTENCVSNNFLKRGDWDIPLSGYITDKQILV